MSKGVVYPMKNVLLIGAGRFGRHIAMQFSQLGHQVMAVDTNEERISDVLPFVTNAQIGDSTSAEFLRSLGIGNFDVCFVTISGTIIPQPTGSPTTAWQALPRTTRAIYG